jgi:hypothetical protein
LHWGGMVLQPQMLKTWLKTETAGGVQAKVVQYESGFTWRGTLPADCELR